MNFKRVNYFLSPKAKYDVNVNPGIKLNMDRFFELDKPNKNEIREALYGEDTTLDWDEWILNGASITLIQEVKREQRMRYLLDCPQLFREDV